MGKDPKPRKLISDLPNLDRHVLGPLSSAGLVYFDEIINMPIRRLCEIVSGPRSQEKLVRALGREREYALYRNKGEIELPDLGTLTLGELRQAAGLRGTARAVLQNPDATVQDLQEALRTGTVSNEQVARYVLERKQARQEMIKGKAKETPVPELPVPIPINLADLDKQIDEVVARYAKDYDTRLWLSADWDAVRRLAMWEIYAAQTQRTLLSRSSDAAFQYAPQLKALTDQVNSALSQIARMREDMGVSLQSRLERDKSSEAHEVISEFVAQAKQLVAERASILIHCGIRLAICIPHFPRDLVVEGSVRQKCPRCGEWVEWQLVTAEMLATYVEAGDFVPAGVPLDALNRPEEERPEFLNNPNANKERTRYGTAGEI